MGRSHLKMDLYLRQMLRGESLGIVDIDASKGIIDLWVHFFVAIEDIHQN